MVSFCLLFLPCSIKMIYHVDMLSCANQRTIFVTVPLDHDVPSVWNTAVADLVIFHWWFYIHFQGSDSCITLFPSDGLFWFRFLATGSCLGWDIFFHGMCVCVCVFLVISFLVVGNSLLKPCGATVFLLGRFSITISKSWIDRRLKFSFSSMFSNLCLKRLLSNSCKLSNSLA